MLQTHVRDRAEAQTSSMTDKQAEAIRRLANDLHRLNTAMIAAVESGLSVELQRGARHHANGGWGDLMIPVVVKTA
ncbi:hypothetical protein [Aestuariivirga sp.]|uniref:SMc00767 family acetate metabolism repressor n=1 Tax=Aestuariivirga sp. TaxID=2650926 RepID=UPI0039E23DD6